MRGKEARFCISCCCGFRSRVEWAFILLGLETDGCDEARGKNGGLGLKTRDREYKNLGWSAFLGVESSVRVAGKRVVRFWFGLLAGLKQPGLHFPFGLRSLEPNP